MARRKIKSEDDEDQTSVPQIGSINQLVEREPTDEEEQEEERQRASKLPRIGF